MSGQESRELFRHVPSLHLPTPLLSGKQAAVYTTRGCPLHLSELPAAETLSKQTQIPRGLLLPELMLQGKKCGLSLELWAQFPQLDPFTNSGDSVLSWWHGHASTQGLSASFMYKTWAVLLLLLWYLSDSVSSSVECE